MSISTLSTSPIQRDPKTLYQGTGDLIAIQPTLPKGTRVAGIEISGSPMRLKPVGGVNQMTRQAVQGDLMSARTTKGELFFWLQGAQNYVLRGANGQLITNPQDAEARARELITYGGASDLLPLSVKYLIKPLESNFVATIPKDGAKRITELADRKHRYVGYTQNGKTLQTHLVAQQHYDAKLQTWVTDKPIAQGLTAYSTNPIIPAQRGRPPEHPQLGYFVSSTEKERTITDGQGKPITDPDLARARVIQMLQYNGFTTRSVQEDQYSQQPRPGLNERKNNPPPKIGKDIRIYRPAVTRTVDAEPGRQRVLTVPESPEKALTGDFTVRVQPWRGKLPGTVLKPQEELVECKIYSSLGRPGCDIKSKWILPTQKIPALHALLKRIHGKIEFESSGAVRFVNGKVLGQGAVSVKLNISDPKPGSLVRVVVGLEFPQFSADMMPIVERILPNLGLLYELLTNPPADRAEFARRFDDLSAQVLIPIGMLGGQISIVYPANNAIKKGLSGGASGSAARGWALPAAILKGTEGVLTGLEATTGFNIRLSYVGTLRDSIPKDASGNFVANESHNVLLVGKDSKGRSVTAQRIEFSRALFGERYIDPSLSEHAAALFERGFNAFQVATLLPLREENPKNDKNAPNPEKALLSPPDFLPQRFKSNELMQLADQVTQAVIDIRGRLPANALRDVPRVFNSYDEAAQAVQKIRNIIHAYGSSGEVTSLEKRFLINLSNRYGVDWGIPKVRQLNNEKYRIDAPSNDLQIQMSSAKKSSYRVSGTPDDKPEIILNSKGEEFSLSIYADNFNGKNLHQKKHFGLVPLGDPLALKKSLDQSIR